MFHRANVKLSYFRSIICAKWGPLPLGLVCTALVLVTFLSRTNIAAASDTQMSIDEVLMAAFQSSNDSGRRNHPGFSRVQIDMIFPTDEWHTMIGEPGSGDNATRRKRRKAMRNETLRWPNGHVPYSMVASFSDEDMRQFHEAIEEYNTFTCIRFRPRSQPRDKDFVKIVNGQGCSSEVGRRREEQDLSLSVGCRTKRIILHELAHVIGFVHEHSRFDRDEYVTIHIDNVHPDNRFDYDKYRWTVVDASDIAYDYKSVMHYGETAGSFRNKRTIETKNSSYQHIIGKGNTFSFGDVKLINMVYRCSEQNKCRRKACPGQGFVGHDCRCWCPSGNDAIPAVVCPGCLDYNEYCPYFKLRGLCNKLLYQEYLLDVCPRSCGSCNPGSA